MHENTARVEQGSRGCLGVPSVYSINNLFIGIQGVLDRFEGYVGSCSAPGGTLDRPRAQRGLSVTAASAALTVSMLGFSSGLGKDCVRAVRGVRTGVRTGVRKAYKSIDLTAFRIEVVYKCVQVVHKNL